MSVELGLFSRQFSRTTETVVQEKGRGNEGFRETGRCGGDWIFGIK